MLLIFDLDGTLIDSRLDLANSVNATRQAMDKGPLPHELIFSYVGNGAPVLIKRAMGPEPSEDQVRDALEFFLNHYKHHAVEYTELYQECAPRSKGCMGQATNLRSSPTSRCASAMPSWTTSDSPA